MKSIPCGQRHVWLTAPQSMPDLLQTQFLPLLSIVASAVQSHRPVAELYDSTVLLHTQLFEAALYLASTPQSGMHLLLSSFWPAGQPQPYLPSVPAAQTAPETLHLHVSPERVASVPQSQLRVLSMKVAPRALHTQYPFSALALVPQSGGGTSQAPFLAFWPAGQTQVYLSPSPLVYSAPVGLLQTHELPSVARVAPLAQRHDLSDLLKVAPGALQTQVLEAVSREALAPQSRTQALFCSIWPEGQVQAQAPVALSCFHEEPGAVHWHDLASLLRAAPSPQKHDLSAGLKVAPAALQTQTPLEALALLPQSRGTTAQAPFLMLWPAGQAQENLLSAPLVQVAPLAAQVQDLKSALREAPSPQEQDLSVVVKVAPGALQTQALVAASREALSPQLTGGPAQEPFWSVWPSGHAQENLLSVPLVQVD